jgi:hypothetical protein
MELFRIGELGVKFGHRHDDGSWGTFEPTPEHHSSADHDPERDWANGTIYKCTTCDEEILVSAPGDPDDSDAPRR